MYHQHSNQNIRTASSYKNTKIKMLHIYSQMFVETFSYSALFFRRPVFRSVKQMLTCLDYASWWQDYWVLLHTTNIKISKKNCFQLHSEIWYWSCSATLRFGLFFTKRRDGPWPLYYVTDLFLKNFDTPFLQNNLISWNDCLFLTLNEKSLF